MWQVPKKLCLNGDTVLGNNSPIPYTTGYHDQVSATFADAPKPRHCLASWDEHKFPQASTVCV